MGSKNKNRILASVASVLVIFTVAVAVWFITDSPTDILASNNNGGVENITYIPAETSIKEATTSAPAQQNVTTTRPSSANTYVENFLAEANTFNQTIEATTIPAGQKPFFHVVTDGTVSEDTLDGLEEPLKTVGEVILAAGFRYDKNQQIFYSEEESWQRNFGFTPFYDAAAAFTGMYYDTMRLKFNYDNMDWMIQIWKGRYGITTGGEMGVYYKEPTQEENFYKCVPDDEMLTMSFALYKGDELYMTRGPEPHWWLTGFKLFDMIAPGDLTMHASFFMEDAGMADALEESLKDLGFIKDINYQRLGLTMTIIWN
ncbi:MAG: DUF4474 domain-containing protein [Clostridia bacterium]|nr:DUF4474 domain-containing protein [Clostridia bacterium]